MGHALGSLEASSPSHMVKRKKVEVQWNWSNTIPVVFCSIKCIWYQPAAVAPTAAAAASSEDEAMDSSCNSVILTMSAASFAHMQHGLHDINHNASLMNGESASCYMSVRFIFTFYTH